MNKKDKCKCTDLPLVFKSYDSKYKLDDINKIDSKSEGWIELYECNKCRSLWQIDKIDNLQVCLCIKISNFETWKDFDDKSIRLEFMTNSRGGVVNEECIMKGCNNNRVKELAYCPIHAYKIGLRD